MSLANVVITHDRALISVDTAAGFMEGAEQLMSERERTGQHSGKLWCFPHINMAMVTRGDGLLTTTTRTVLESALPSSFDDAIHMMPNMLEQAYAHVLAFREEKFGIESFPGAEVVLVGWSPCNLGFQAMRWRRYPADTDFIQSRVDKMLLLPEIDRIEPVDLPDTAEKMEAVARRQVKWARQEHPSLACGGRLLLAELTRDAVTVRTIADLEAK
ncbi:hypothetical protein [Achromobacter insuavis]|uniref:hypothetical protein n=1 Tax=Achromobacter insuavis TaxID=1287735 RepID=UPI0029D81712|nr:hypothetical protein [Achromobacter sp.]MCG2604108.1 hypothetical protein [Achromobacter sp.]